MGWDMPGLDHVYQNNVQGVPAGVLLTVGDGTGWYFTQGSGNSYTSPSRAPTPSIRSPASPAAAGSLSINGGTTFDFSSGGY